MADNLSDSEHFMRQKPGNSAHAPLPEVVYTPQSPLRHPRRLVREMMRDLQASRGLAWRLFVRDVSARYRQSLLGYVWAFLPPVAAMVTFGFLHTQRIITVGEIAVPYPAFVLIGTLLWTTFLDALDSPLKAATASRAMLAKINFPREALLLSGMAEVVFNCAIRAVLLVPLFVYYGLAVPTSALLVPIGIAALILLGLAFGLLITPLGLLYADVGRGVVLVAGFWMLLTPIAYQPPTAGPGAWLVRWNPVTPLLETSRDWLTGVPAAHIGPFILVTALALGFLLSGWLFYRLSMPIVIERFGG